MATTLMASDDGASSPAKKPTPKKANLLDPHSIKHLLDETISDVLKSKGYAEDARLSNWKLAIGAAPRRALSIALGLLYLQTSGLPRFSYMYTLTIASAEAESISANEPVHFTKSVTKWFTKDGVLVEGVFWTDVEKLIDDYNNVKSI